MRIIVKTEKKKQIIDITDKVEELAAGKSGLCALFLQHTTAAITAADLDPGTDLDMLDALEEMVPKLNYRHPHDPAHVWTHIMSSVIGPSLVVPAKNGKLQLGAWQRVVLMELDGPRERKLEINFFAAE